MPMHFQVYTHAPNGLSRKTRTSTVAHQLFPHPRQRGQPDTKCTLCAPHKYIALMSDTWRTTVCHTSKRHDACTCMMHEKGTRVVCNGDVVSMLCRALSPPPACTSPRCLRCFVCTTPRRDVASTSFDSSFARLRERAGFRCSVLVLHK